MGQSLMVHLETENGGIPSLEIYTAETRKDLLEETLGVKMDFVVDKPAAKTDGMTEASRVPPEKLGA